MTARRRSSSCGILLVDKPLGPSSHDVVSWARWALRERSVGHCGTLDPAASGLLVLCVGEATKLVEHLTGVDKRYRARFVLGASTTTADAQGEVTERAEVDEETAERGGEILAAMVGPLHLPPPAFSAVKLAGRRAHELARAGERPELPPRAMALHELEVEEAGPVVVGEGSWWIDATMRVAKGTYVRSLAQELGRRLGVPAHLGGLRRLACGALEVDDPKAVGGLLARPLPARGEGKPRWRIELPGEADEAGQAGEASEDRQRTGALLHARMDAPWERLPFEVSILRGKAHQDVFARLLQGQRLRLDGAGGPGLDELGLSRSGGPCALVDPAMGRMVVGEREADGRGWRLCPRRVLRFSPHSH